VFKRFDRPVRCSAGHTYTTIWMPLGSLKGLRLGRRRFQRCPVGHHWAITARIGPESASRRELRRAAVVHDLRIP
jgi:uncharacterized protein (TIGR03382 family)